VDTENETQTLRLPVRRPAFSLASLALGAYLLLCAAGVLALLLGV
jgi:hypothetical protein